MQKNLLDYSILFIEDELDIRKNYIRYLKRHYKDVYEAADGQSGLELYKQKKPDILIIDINLPKMSGIEMLKEVRKTDHTTRAIMLTAHSEVDILLQATELKLTKYLLKPISREELKEALLLAINEKESFQTASSQITNLKEGYSWNHDKKELYLNLKHIKTTPIEKKILELLFSKPNATCSSDDILIYVWDTFEDDKQIALKNAIRKLRLKLPKDTILNSYGEGFKLVV